MSARAGPRTVSSCDLRTYNANKWICRGCLHTQSTNRSRQRRLGPIKATQKSLGYTGSSISIRYSSSGVKSKDESTSTTPSSTTTTATPAATAAAVAAEAAVAAAKEEKSKAEELPSHSEQRRSRMSKRFSSLMDNMQANIFFAGQRLNDLTGYSGIEQLKRDIDGHERALRAAQEALAAAKEAYAAAISRRSGSQREVNELLQRKNSWGSADLERFTALYRSDHANELAESGARALLDEAERAADEAAARLSAKILARYHEEQIWSDKIRRMSTWGTWGLMGVNVLLFLVFQIGVEPWRRRRLVKGFEEKVKEALEENNNHNNSNQALTQAGTVSALQASRIPDESLEAEMAVEGAVAEEVAAESNIPSDLLIESVPTRGFISWMPGLGVYKKKVDELFSESQVTVRRVDLTQKALEGMFAGVMLASVIATLVRGR